VPDAPTPQDPLEEEPALVRGAPASLSHGQLVLFPDRESYLDLVRALADDDGYAMCVDLCGVDYLLNAHRGLPPDVAPERFEVVVNLLSLAEHKRVRLRVQVPAADPILASLFEVYPGTEAMEREAYDLFGIVFTGHSDMRHILLPDDWEGHPLRKDWVDPDFSVQFKAAPGNPPT
jgi:NADH-quinone oxidoreductase subunit C